MKLTTPKNKKNAFHSHPPGLHRSICTTARDLLLLIVAWYSSRRGGLPFPFPLPLLHPLPSLFVSFVFLGQVDLLLVTHFHLDHAASLPYLTEKTGFKGRIFCTHPTKAVMRMLLADYIRLVNVHTEDILYDEKVFWFLQLACFIYYGARGL